jgi:DNA-binding NarL/FixJ family response regulator
VEIGSVMVRMIRRLLPSATVGAVLSGAQFAVIIKARWPTTRVIILSESAERALGETARTVQADAYLVKPFSRDELTKVLMPLLEH